MLDTVILALITLLTEIAGLTTSSSEISKILQAVINLLPTLEKEYQSLVGPVKNIIAALSANPATTAQQLAVAQALDSTADAAFEAAVAGYNTANPNDPLTLPAVAKA